MVAIANYEVYTSSMSKALYDKAFFLDKLQTDNPVVVDYGCADGALGRFVHALLPNVLYIGYDTNDDMLVRARGLIPDNPWSHEENRFTSRWDLIETDVKGFKKLGREVVIVANSVMHEVYEYGHPALFWSHLFTYGFDSIFIRDMVMPSGYTPLTGGRWSDLNALTLSDVDAVSDVRENVDPEILSSFELMWGPIRYETNLIHFLMKYRYAENWSRENAENYFPLNSRQFKTIINENSSIHGYIVDFLEEYGLRYNRRRIHEDFGFDFDVRTHTRLMLRRK